MKSTKALSFGGWTWPRGNSAWKTWFIPGASRGFGARITERALAQIDNVVATARPSRAMSLVEMLP